jgi:3-phenylpropionate/trans-cinnamate dioxygenase ferredoxin reductase component
MQRSIVIVGGGLAAAAAAESYRSAGGDVPVTILSADADRPVHRPPLSKEYLRGDATLDSVYVHHADFYTEQDIDLRLNTRVVAIDREAGEVVLAEGERIAYGTLVLATGARSRTVQLPGATLPGTFSLRSLASAEALKLTFADAARAVIVGAGFIGMEVAATLTQRGVRTTVVEMAPRMWQALVPPVVSDFVQSYYRDRGVDFRFSSGVRAIEGDGRVERVVLGTGESLEADLVVVGVGAELNTGLAEHAGLAVERGVTVDEFFQTSDPRIYAIGDIASFPDPVAGRIHLEHWDNALSQGRALGQTLAGKQSGFHHTAYFFSDLFDLSLNMVGYPSGWDDVIVRGDPADRQFTVVYLREGRVRAALMINDDEHMDAWTRMVDARQPADASLSDRDIAPLEAAV